MVESRLTAGRAIAPGICGRAVSLALCGGRRGCRPGSGTEAGHGITRRSGTSSQFSIVITIIYLQKSSEMSLLQLQKQPAVGTRRSAKAFGVQRSAHGASCRFCSRHPRAVVVRAAAEEQGELPGATQLLVRGSSISVVPPQLPCRHARVCLANVSGGGCLLHR